MDTVITTSPEFFRGKPPDGEIERLVDSLTGTNNVLLSYVNQDSGTGRAPAGTCEMETAEAISLEQISQISGYLDTWDSVSFDNKWRGVDLMITTIAAASDSLNIIWKI